MSILKYLLGTRPKSAAVAKERLQIILAHERAGRDAPDYLPALQSELLAVVAKYVNIDPGQVKVNLDRNGDYEVLELNVVLPEVSRQESRASRR